MKIELRKMDILLLVLIGVVFCYSFFISGTRVIEVEKTTDFQFSVSKVKPAVVKIFAETELKNIPYVGDYISLNDKIYSGGTGFFVSDDGKIATEAHVVGDSNNIVVFVQNEQSQYTATILEKNKDADLAIIKIAKISTPSVKMANFESVAEGEEVGFIGYPLYFQIPLLTKGIISAKGNYKLDDTLNPIKLSIINSFVNRGNSGGPLFKAKTGEVIGIVNSRSKTNEVANQIIRLPDNYSPGMTIGGVDPITLSVETYNRAVGLIGDVSQIGIGFSASSDYITELIQK